MEQVVQDLLAVDPMPAVETEVYLQVFLEDLVLMALQTLAVEVVVVLLIIQEAINKLVDVVVLALFSLHTFQHK